MALVIIVFSDKNVVQGSLCQVIDHFDAVKFPRFYFIEEIQEASIIVLYIYDSPLHQPSTA
jgi:hypothetical protein